MRKPSTTNSETVIGMTRVNAAKPMYGTRWVMICSVP